MSEERATYGEEQPDITPEWTLENLTEFVLQQGAEIRHCEDCAMESRCKKVNFWCRPFRLLAEELGIEVNDATS